MDDLIEKIKEEIENDIAFCEEHLKQGKTNKTLIKAEELINILKEKGKKSLIESSLFEIYVTISALLNEFDSYEEIRSVLEPSKNRINNWQVSDIKAMSEIEEEYRCSKERCIKTVSTLKKCYGLGLTKEALKYNIYTAFRAIAPILNFKANVENIVKKEKNEKVKAKQIEHFFLITEVNNLLQITENFLRQRQLLQKERIKELTERIEKIKKFKEEEIQQGCLEEATELPSYMKGVLSEHTLDQIYHLFLLNLQVEEETLNTELKIMNKILSDPIVRLLYENNVDPNEVEDSIKEKLNQLPFSLVEKVFTLFSKIGLNIKEILHAEESIWEKIDIEALDMIEFLYENGILRKETLQTHLSIFTKEARKVITNYEILKPIIDFKSKYYADTILLVDPMVLKNRLTILAEYNLTKNDYIFLLCHYEYIGIYDLILEQNINRYLFIGICMTENPIQTIKRICLSMILDIPYKTATNLLKKDVKEERHFICEDSTLDEYLSLIEYQIEEEGTSIGDIKQDPIVKQLDEEYRLEDIYYFNNTSISRPKFLKNLQRRKDNNQEIKPNILNCLLADSFVDDKKMLEIKKAIEKM